MADIPTDDFDCGHRCCDEYERSDPHDHFLRPKECPSCQAITWRELPDLLPDERREEKP